VLKELGSAFVALLKEKRRSDRSSAVERKRSVATSLIRACFRAAMILAQTAASPQKEPYDASSYAHAHHLIDVAGRRMNIYCTGAGSPTVILDAGLGGDTTDWRLVQSPIARRTRVCSYDRAGMGFSDPTTSSRDAGAVTAELHALLRGAGIAPPYVLVGHSIAGLYARFYTDHYPGEIVGLVLVEPSTEYDEQQFRKVAPAYERAIVEWRKQLEECVAGAARGKCPLVPSPAEFSKGFKAAGCPEANSAACAVAKVEFEQAMQSDFWKDTLLEALAIPMSSAQVHAEQGQYGSLPLVVLTAGQPDNIPIPPAQLHAIWLAGKELHDRIAALSSRGVSFVIRGSGHYIQLDQPSAVISAVDEVVDQARYGARP
jgi:pimeloyl-ACP methyl ester carboxylesterase